MRMLGLTSIVLAAGLALGAPGHAQNTAAPAEAPAAAATAPAPAAAPAAAATPAVADPTLDASGKPLNPGQEGVGYAAPGGITMLDQVTPTGRELHWFHNAILLPLITIISLFVLALMIWVVIRYRRAANPEPSRTSHNTLIEIIWTLAPVLILVAIAIPSIKLLAAQFSPPPKEAVTLKAIGNQWFWTYEYPDHGVNLTSNMLKEQDQVAAGARFRTDADGPRLLAVDQRVVLPVGVPIRLQTTAQDVIHSWAIPAFALKLDAVPGKINELGFTIEKPGVYYGQCSELCGARHAYMPIVVEAVSPEVFAQWVASKGGKMPSAAAEPVAASGNDTADDTANGMTDEGAPTVNATAAPVVTNQSATANPAGLGQADQ